MEQPNYFSSKKSVIGLVSILVVSLLLLTIVLTSRQNRDAQDLLSRAQESISPTPASFVFGASGDHGRDSSTQTQLRSIGAEIGNGNMNFFISLGDLAYGGGTETSWCDMVKNNLNIGAGRTLGTYPFLLIAGGHDACDNNSNYPASSTDGYIDRFIASNCLPYTFPVTPAANITPAAATEDGKQFFFDYPVQNPIARFIVSSPQLYFQPTGGTCSSGSRVHYTMTRGSARYNWVKDRIREAREQGLWVIGINHENYVSLGDKGDEIGADYMNLMLGRDVGPGDTLAQGVDLLLQGHDHNYERSKQLRLTPTLCPTIGTGAANTGCIASPGSNFARGAGTVLAIDGAGGHGFYTVQPADPHWPYFQTAQSNNYGYLKITVTNNQISGQFVNTSGGSYSDSFTIADSGAPTNTPPPPTNTPTPVPPTNTPTPYPTRPPSEYREASDIRNDGSVTVVDMNILRRQIGQICTSAVECADINCDGVVNTQDLTILQNNFGLSAPGSVPVCAYLANPPSTVTLNAIADSYVNASAATTNYGTSTTLISDLVNPLAAIYTKFDMTLYAGRSIATAKLRVTTTSASNAGSAVTQSVRIVSDNSWTEGGINYSNRPAVAVNAAGTLTGSVPNTTYEITLSPSALQQYVGGFISLAIDESQDDGFHINSREVTTSSQRPQLVLTFN